ncbi:hypothetical protein [Gemmiger qucibialis]|uniref:hypothetical protein n=1 Tax=Gemmiger qucibialis TaxID=2997294 RepID=UPI0022E514B3|nr:hypothetical protein [Gemmiger qucibialis]
MRLKHRSGSCGTASAAPRSPYRHLELCGIALAVKVYLIPPKTAAPIVRYFVAKGK